jgi:ubiquinone/menaquinone biosynthesis C-methylase UbiE
MAMIRPGGVALTGRAVDLAGLRAGDRVLDVGCGEGDTVLLLREKFEMDAVGVDVSSKMIDRGKARHPELDLQRMEAHALAFDSRTFDAVFMECSLSVMRLQEDVCFEAYCMLKPGGKLIITDLYLQNPDMERVAAMLIAAQEKASRPKIDNACEENENPSFIMLDGAILADELHGMLEEIGFKLVHFEDVPHALSNFAAQAVMGFGSLDAYFKATVPEGDDPNAYCSCEAFQGKKNLGYFLMILEKE